MSTAAPIYQINYSEHDVGKSHPDSKKEVKFLFAMQQKEYEVVFKWSFSSGKQSVVVNGRDEFFSKVKGASVFDKKITCGPANDDLQLHLIGTRTKPKGAASLSYRCFELIINQTTLFSACPMANGGQQPYQGGESIIDLLYPNHPCRNPQQHHQQHQDNGYIHHNGYQQQPSTPVDMYATASPVKPVQNIAPDLLLDMNPTPAAPDPSQHQNGMVELFLPMGQTMVDPQVVAPAYNNNNAAFGAPDPAYNNSNAAFGAPQAAPAAAAPYNFGADMNQGAVAPAYTTYTAPAAAPPTVVPHSNCIVDMPAAAPQAVAPPAYDHFGAFDASAAAPPAQPPAAAQPAFNNFSAFDTPAPAGPPAANPFTSSVQ